MENELMKIESEYEQESRLDPVAASLPVAPSQRHHHHPSY